MNLKTLLIILTFILSGLAGLFFSLKQHHKIENTVASHSPTAFIQQITGDANAGEKIFKEFCTLCHGKNSTIDVNAPKIGDHRRWQLIKSQGMQTMLALTVNGFAAMPARGGCFECSDDQLQQTIEYILKNSE